MKKILIAATAVGAAIAGIILYNKRRMNGGSAQVEDAAKNAYDTMNNGLGKIERSAFHSMG
ncbi:MAG TPA: hypothetical protein VI385_05690 [Flavisolibacter sp.]